MRRRAFLTSGALATAGTVLAPQVLRAAPRVIRFSHVAAEETPKGHGARLFRQRIEERTDGRIRVEIFPNGELFGEDDEMEALALGHVQVIVPSLSRFTRYARQFQVFDLPFLFDSLQALDRFEQSEEGVGLRVSMERLGFVGLGYWRDGWKQLTANRALRQPSDAAGLIFGIRPSPVLARQFEVIDASSMPLDLAEMASALRSGAIEGTEQSWPELYSSDPQALQPFITQTDHGIAGAMVTVSTEFWSDLPPDLREMFSAVTDEVRVMLSTMADGIHQMQLDQILRAGRTRLVALTQAERQDWRDALRPIWASFEEEIGPELLQAARRANIA